MRGAQTATAIAMEILIEQQVVTESGPAKALVGAEHRSRPVIPGQKDATQPVDDLIGDFSKVAHAPRTHRAFHRELIAIIAVEAV